MTTPPAAGLQHYAPTYQEEWSRSVDDPDAFWLEQSRKLAWYTPPTTGRSRDLEGLDQWFADGELNTCYLAIDRHVEKGRGQQIALIYDSPVTQCIRKYSYQELQHKVAHLAGGLQQLGVGKGDRVLIYMPMVPEAAMAMLAVARLGAIHSVVFGGFAAHELALRIDHAQPRAILTASCGIEVDHILPYKPIIDQALQEAAHRPEAVVYLDRDQQPVQLTEPHEYDWQQLVAGASPAPCVAVRATDPLYILYTSGTTGKPKGIIRDNGGHAVALHYSMEAVYGVEPGEVFWAASDVGWVVGHSYIVYAPLIRGCTSIVFEGKPVRTPDASTVWRMLEQHQVNVFFTAPTAFRAIAREDYRGHWPAHYSLRHLRRIYVAGERCDQATLEWVMNVTGKPVIDHWWQTESGWPMLANPAGLEMLPIKPGSSSKPVPGYDIRVLRADATECSAHEEGAVVVKLPLPPGCLPNLWHDTPRFRAGYLDPFPGYYYSGDGGYFDEEGYFFITGRLDDIINVSGHRLSTAEMEEVVASHPDVAECAVIGVADSLRGQRPVGLVVPRSLEGEGAYERLVEEIIRKVREQIGAVAFFKSALIVDRLPKTRSGKILRRTLRALADGKEAPVPSTVEDPSVVDEIASLMQDKGLAPKTP